MIKLEVEDYCHKCTEFEADVEQAHMISIDWQEWLGDTIIRCEHREKCKRIRAYAEQNLRGE